uniref:GH26 domain-containing protein n=1 Tax=Octactis speculum TaxID=3111310 RepID=A0A7S2C2A0_9STRA|mmetsp:Transcript_30788/g.41671  ORF Transcript_30788/g.41671 Transcript_30788/m.41671 type:complete len:499 (+) Transcript_30788:78-1574(+)|eukprot:CAMPEP_0185777524 /NCGR_PEP_ID=MMETSP1174-20130828/89765_1 /TAXON_ID=35687 /ORGANISM="Dictyocha speculum, Strain CCMP1381" /LENGTH=498 /DNA_ID=CAMNT_0028465923 /DNA_START=66 /DNA_END=1562 /DNA_ORIENTATION=+
MASGSYRSIERKYDEHEPVEENLVSLEGRNVGKYRSISWPVLIVASLMLAGVAISDWTKSSSQIAEEQYSLDASEATSDASDATSRTETTSKTEVYDPVDMNSTDLTKKLYYALQAVSESEAFGFGHQYTNVYGQHWSHPDDVSKSDVANSTDGDYPLVFGYDIQYILDGYDVSDYVMYAAEQGAVLTFYWQAHNPITNGNSHDCGTNGINDDDVVSLILNGDSSHLAHGTWLNWLDQVADFFETITVGGEKVPIIFRLFHEGTEDWYWWGTDCSLDSEFVDLWEMTQDYLTLERGMHNILWEYAPSKPSENYDLSFSSRYPGDERVDIIGFDRYSAPETYVSDVIRDCTDVTAFAKKRNKISALTETGVFNGIGTIETPAYYHFYTTEVLHPIINACPELVYALTFTNFNTDKYWVPLPGQATYSGFREFYESNETYFLADPRWRSIEYVFMINKLATSDDASSIGEGRHSGDASPHASDSPPSTERGPSSDATIPV